MTLQAIAETLHITPRSARRYLDELYREVEKAPSGSRSPLWRLKASHRPRQIGLRPMQVYSLLATRRAFDVLRGSALHDEIDLAHRALLGLARKPGRTSEPTVADTRLDERFVYVPHAQAEYPGQAEDIDVILQAAVALHPVACRYRDARGKDSRVTLHPYAIAIHQDAVHVVGRHVEEDQVGVFPLHALTDAEALAGTKFAIPSSFDVGAHLPRSFGVHQATRQVKVVVDFDAQAAQLVRGRRFSPTQRRSSMRGGGIRLTLSAGDLSEVARWVLGFGAHARVVEPDALRERVIRELRNALTLYRDRKGA